MDLIQWSFQLKATVLSSGSSRRLRGAERHEIYAAAFGGHLFYDIFLQGQGRGGDMAPLAHPDPLLVLVIRVFRKLTKLAIMAILASEALLREKIQWQNVTPGGNRTQVASDSKSNTILSTLTWHMLLRRSLNFCLCTTYAPFDIWSKENQ